MQQNNTLFCKPKPRVVEWPLLPVRRTSFKLGPVFFAFHILVLAVVAATMIGCLGSIIPPVFLFLSGTPQMGFGVSFELPKKRLPPKKATPNLFLSTRKAFRLWEIPLRTPADGKITLAREMVFGKQTQTASFHNLD